MLKFYSDLTKQVYETQEECEKAEKALAEKKNARETRAKEVEEAVAAAHEATTHAREVLSQFCKDYGSYHTTIKSLSDFDPFEWLHDLFF